MISSLITQIENNEIVLPAIQRDFVWDEDRITKLFDSIMRSYPIGITLLWETYVDIKYREFVKDYQTDSKYLFKDNDKNKRIRLVLDGQQRLQALYLGLKGSLDNKELFIDALSGKTEDDFREVFFVFRFIKNSEAMEINSQNRENRLSQSQSQNGEQEKFSLFISVKEILDSSPEVRLKMKLKYKNEFLINEDELIRFELNLNKLIHSISNDPNILKVSTIDENKTKESQERKSESDILEAFVRINRQGISLSRSDLIFSMLKLNWKESAEELPNFIRDINNGNNLSIDVDFVIRSLFTVSDLGSKFDVDLLRKSSNVRKVKENYLRTCNAIKSLVDFMQDDCKILNSNIIGGYLNLIPFVYYLANSPDNLVPNSELNKVKKALYIFGYTRPFSRYADSRIGKFIKQEIKPKIEDNDYSFPLDASIWWANYWEYYNSFDVRLLQRNRQLTLHLLQNKTGTKFKYERNAPEIDHIFPQSILFQKGFDVSLINSYGNFWILAKTKNQNKSNKHPKEYFEDVEDSILEKTLIKRDMLDYRKFSKFVKEREIEILEKIKKNISIKDSELDFK